MKRWLFLLGVFLWVVQSTAARAADWPAGWEELEGMAVKDPGPGAAFGSVCKLAADMGRVGELRERWVKRNDEAGFLLLGWLESASGKDEEARVYFKRAAEVATKSFRPKMALARSLAADGQAEAEAMGREALAAAGSETERGAALRHVAHGLAGKGEVAGARRLMAEEFQKAAPVARLGLVPEATAAALADGRFEAWFAELKNSHEASAAWQDTGTYVLVCLTVNEPMLALTAARDGLGRHPGEAALRRLAARAAFQAGFLTEGVQHTLAALGEPAEAGEVNDAMVRFLELGCVQAVLDLAKKYPGQLAAGAARWRRFLPDLARLGVLGEFRAALAPGVRAEDWEGQLALAESAVLDRDRPAAAERLWRLVERPADKLVLSSLTRAQGNRGWGEFTAVPLPGCQFAHRLAEARALYAEHGLFSGAERLTWSVPSLADARDYAIVTLHLLAIEAETEADFLTRLQRTTEAWPAAERLHAGALIGSPRLMLEGIEKIAAAPGASDKETLAYASDCAGGIVRLPWLEGSLAKRVRMVKLPEPDPKADAALEHRWKRELRQCFDFFAQGKLEEAERTWLAAQPGLRAHGIVLLETFYNSLVSAVDQLTPMKRFEAMDKILEWMARETATQLDLPLAPNPAILTQPDSAPQNWARMFAATNLGGRVLGQSGPYVRSPGEWVAREQSKTLWYWHIKARTAVLRRPGQPETKLTGEALRVWQSYRALLAVWSVEVGATGTPRALADLEKGAPTPEAVVLKTYLENRRREEAAAVGRGGEVAPVPRKEWPGTPGRAAWLAASALLKMGATPVEELAANPPPPFEQWKILGQLGQSAPVEAAKLAKAWTTAVTAETIEPLDTAFVLQKMLLLAEGDRALALARQILEKPFDAAGLGAPEDGRGLAELRPRVAAFRALREMSELQPWVEELQKRVKANPEDQRARWALVEASRQMAPASEEEEQPRRGGLARRQATAARQTVIETLPWLAANAPRPLVAWTLWQGVMEETEQSAFYDALAAQLRGPKVNDFSALELKALLDYLPPAKQGEVFAALVAPERKLARGLIPTLREAQTLSDAMWLAGKKQEAMIWCRRAMRQHLPEKGEHFQKLVLSRAAFLGDAEALAECIVEAIEAQTRTATETRAFLISNPYEEVQKDRTVRGLFEAAERHGVAARVRALVARQAGQGPALELFARVLAKDEKAIGELQARLEDAAAEPLPNGLLEEFAGVLAGHPAGKALAVRILNQLEPYREARDRDLAMLRLTRHAEIGLEAGAPAAEGWLEEATKMDRSLRTSSRNQVLPKLLMAAVRLPKSERAEQLTKRLLAEFGRVNYSAASFYEELDAAAERGERALVEVWVKAIEGMMDYRSRMPAELQVLEMHRQYAAMCAGDLRMAAPMAWVMERDLESGKAKIAWNFGWSRRPKDGAGSPITGVPGATVAGKFAVELYGGRPGRLELLERVEETSPGGTFEVNLAPGTNWLAMTARDGERTVLGGGWEGVARGQALPLAQQLKAPYWFQKEGGPGGKYFVPATEPIPQDRGNLDTLLGVFQVDARGALRFAAWLRKGGVKVFARDQNGRVTKQHILQYVGPGWTMHETTIGLEGTVTGPYTVPAGTKDVAIYAAGNAEIGGVWFAPAMVLPAER